MSNEEQELQERISLVLVEHFFHNAEFGGIGGRWSIECNCDEVVTANSHPEVEGAFAKHQADAVFKTFFA
jgi:hypothetical protein